VIDDGGQRRETAVVIEAAVGVREQRSNRRCPVPQVWRTIRLKVIDAAMKNPLLRSTAATDGPSLKVAVT
jgi:hypothetical protein